MSNIEIFNKIISIMTEVDKKEISGEDKKELVIKIIKEHIENTYVKDTYEEWEGVIPFLIDLVILISKNKKLVNNINRGIKKCCF